MKTRLTRNDFVEWGRQGGKIGGKMSKPGPRDKCKSCGSFVKTGETSCGRCKRLAESK